MRLNLLCQTKIRIAFNIVFTKLIGRHELKSVKGSYRLWKKNELEFPRLFLLWQVLSNISKDILK